jgi:serine protease Do
MESSRETSILKLLTLILTLGIGFFGLYEYKTAKNLETQVQSIKNQVATLAVSAGSSTPLSLTSAVAKVAPAVVSIVISKNVPNIQVRYENFFGYQVPIYMGQDGVSRQDVGAGSGFFIRSDGYIVTNKHVVDDPSAEYMVTLTNNKQVPAKVIYIDPTTDIAIIKIGGTGYPTVTLGNSTNLAQGQTVAAIGNALGEYSNSVSTGIISGLNRDIDAEDPYGKTETLKDVIQTDAAINLGNSGGPLLDLQGDVIGVNVATVVGSNSIAFAIPVNVVKSIISRVL